MLIKFSGSSSVNQADFDILVAEVYERVVSRRDSVRETDKYASWVSVVCRNVFINYIRKKKEKIPFDENDGLGLVSEPKELAQDTTLLIQVLEQAISRLPRYLQDIAFLRILENRSYEEISAKTGKRIQIIRTYMNKARQRLKNDRTLRIFLDEEFREKTKK